MVTSARSSEPRLGQGLELSFQRKTGGKLNPAEYCSTFS
jgi:hypothetical protein